MVVLSPLYDDVDEEGGRGDPDKAPRTARYRQHDHERGAPMDIIATLLQAVAALLAIVYTVMQIKAHRNRRKR